MSDASGKIEMTEVKKGSVSKDDLASDVSKHFRNVDTAHNLPLCLFIYIYKPSYDLLYLCTYAN